MVTLCAGSFNKISPDDVMGMCAEIADKTLVCSVLGSAEPRSTSNLPIIAPQVIGRPTPIK